jgi:hypothetical protein
MRGYPGFNFDAFEDYAKLLRLEGYNVTSPHEMDIEEFGKDAFSDPEGLIVDSASFVLNEVLAGDLDFICREADMICVLPGWEDSKGTLAEIATAEALGIEVVYVE